MARPRKVKKERKGKGKKGRKTTSLEEDDFVKEDEEYDSDQDERGEKRLYTQIYTWTCTCTCILAFSKFYSLALHQNQMLNCIG